MKRILSLVLVIVLTLSFSACRKPANKNTAAPSTDFPTTDEVIPLTEEPAATVENSADYTSASGTPNFSIEQQRFYQSALSLYRSVREVNLTTAADEKYTVKRGGLSYTLVEDRRFDTLAGLKATLATCFTEDFINQKILTPIDGGDRYLDIDGKLYQLNYGRGGRMDYAGHVFSKPTETDSTITFTATVYYLLDGMPEDAIYETPSDLSLYQTEDLTFTLTKTDAGWRYSEFHSFY